MVLPTALDVHAEVELQLRESYAKMTPFQVLLTQEQLSFEPSRLHARLCAYVRLVADVEAYAAAEATLTRPKEADLADPLAIIAPSPSPSPAPSTPGGAASTSAASAASSSSSSAAAAAAPSTSPSASPSAGPVAAPVVVPLAPVLTHPTFLAALEDHLLRLLEERWEALFASYTTADGKRISKAERHAKGLNKGSLVYGEVSFHSLGEVLWGPWCRDLKPGCVFVDLGSGTGRGLLAAASLFPFGKLVGIEILEGLHTAALEVSEHYDRVVRPCFDTLTDARASMQMELVCGSFLDYDWPNEADVVFANSTCFDDALMDEIALQGQALRDGVIVITLTKALTSPYFDLLYSEQHQMSWGMATVNIMRKQTPNEEEIATALAMQQAEKAKQRARSTDLE